MRVEEAYANFRRWMCDKIWYWRALREVKKMYPKGTPMRNLMIYTEIYYMNMARKEEEIRKIWGNKL